MVIYKQLTLITVLKLLLSLTLVFWLVSIDLQPRHLVLGLKTDSQQSQKVEVFFLKQGKPESAFSRIVNAGSKTEAYYFKFPDHTTPDQVLIDLGTPPANWSISDVGVYSNFFVFGFDSHFWKMPHLNRLVKPNGSSVSLEFKQNIQVLTHKEPGRVLLGLEYSKLQPSYQLLMLKGLAVAGLLAIMMLLWSRYFWQLFATRKIDAAAFYDSYQQIWSNSRHWMLAGSVGVVVVMAAVIYPNFLLPGLFIEDAMEFSDMASGLVDMSDAETYRYWRGYPVLASELLAYSASLFPLEMVPRLYLLLSASLVLIAALSMSYSGLFQSPLVLLIAPLALVFGAFSEPSMYLTVTGSLFSSTALLMAIAIKPAPKTNLNFVLVCLLITVLAFSGPYTTQLFPMAIAIFALNSAGKKSIFLILMALLAVVYISNSSSGVVAFSNIFDPSVRISYFDNLVRMIFLLEIFAVVDYRYGLAIIMFFVGVLVFFRDDRLFIKHSLVFLSTCLVSMMTYFISSKYQQYGGLLIAPHTVISQFCWVIFVLLCLDKLIKHLQAPLVRLFTGMLAVVFICSVVVAKDRVRHDRSNLRPDPKLASFVRSIERVKALSIADNEFIQLIYNNQHDQLTSALIGSSAADAVAVEPSRLPDIAQDFYFPIQLKRNKNVVIDYIKGQNALRYSDGTWLKMPEGYKQL